MRKCVHYTYEEQRLISRLEYHLLGKHEDRLSHDKALIGFEPRHNKICLRGFRSGRSGPT